MPPNPDKIAEIKNQTQVHTLQEGFNDALHSGVAIKLHNSKYLYSDLAPTIDVIRKKGIAVGGWGYVYLKYNALREAETAAKAIRAYLPEFYLIDAEVEAYYQFAPALLFAKKLRSEVGPAYPLGVNSYWKPTYHKPFSWYQLRQVCDFDCPQVYWRSYLPVGKLDQSKKEYAALSPKLPFSMAAGDMYFEHGIKPTPQQVTEFLSACWQDSEIKAALMWSMDQKKVVPELWDVFGRFDWKTGECPEEPVVVIETKRLPLYAAAVNATAGFNVRRVPSTINNKPVYAAPFGDRVDVYHHMSGWAAISPNWDNLPKPNECMRLI